MADTNKSIAENIIDPTLYVQGGGVIDGKLGFENIPEDWIMYAQLFVKTKSRSVLVKNNANKIVSSGEQEYLVAEIPYYKQNVNKNDTGKVIPFDIQTTEYTDLMGSQQGMPMTKGGAPNTLGQESSFGIKDISISFENTQSPTIDINFVDIRGVGLTAYGPDGGITKSPYSWFFINPPPEFCLKVKGFFGKSVSIPLRMHKFDIRYNSSSGNFDIATKFAGYPFSVFNDIPLKYLDRLCCIPGGSEALANSYNKLVNSLDPNSPDDKIILQELPSPDHLCLKDYTVAMTTAKMTNPVKEAYDRSIKTSNQFITQYNELNKRLNSVLSYVRKNGGSEPEMLYANFINLLCKNIELEASFQESLATAVIKTTKDGVYDGLGKTKDTEHFSLTATDSKKKTTITTVPNFYDFITQKKLGDVNFGKILIATGKSYLDPCPGKNATIETAIKSAVEKILTNLKPTDKPEALFEDAKKELTSENFLKGINNNVIDVNEKILLILREQYVERLRYLDGYNKYLCGWFKVEEPKLSVELPDASRVTPTLQRIVTLMAINVDAFLSLLLKVSIEAERYHEENKETADYASSYSDASNSSLNQNNQLRNSKLYAWPKTYKEGERGKVEAFPPEINESFSDWPEVKFTLDYIDAIGSADCDGNGTIITTGVGTGNWMALNIFEDPFFTKYKQLNSIDEKTDSPYNNFMYRLYSTDTENVDSVDGKTLDKLKELITSRAIVNLFYFNRLWDDDESNAGYIQQLAERDADNLITTMSDCNLVYLIKNKLAGESGKILLENYAKSSAVQTFAKNQSLEDKKTGTKIPYGLTFYLGNNTTKTIVKDSNNQGIIYEKSRTAEVDLLTIFDTNFSGLTFFDKPQYPFDRYVTIHLTSGMVVTGFLYEESYATDLLKNQPYDGVIYNYSPLVKGSCDLPLGIVPSNIPNSNIPQNYYYNTSDYTQVISYSTFLNPSHIRDVSTFNLDGDNSLQQELPYTYDNKTKNTKLYELGNGIPTYKNLVTKMVPNNNASTRCDYTFGNILSYKPISNDDKTDPIEINNTYHPINNYDEKTYYVGYASLLNNISNTIRAYPTTYGYYLSDILKSFLWDPYKSCVGNGDDKNTLAPYQAKSSSKIINVPGSTFSVTDKQGKSNQVSNDWEAGAYWGKGNKNTGFQNTIFYSTNQSIPHKIFDSTGVISKPTLPIFYYGQEKNSDGNSPSLIQYLFKDTETKWIKDFTDSALGINYEDTTITLSKIFIMNNDLKNKSFFTNYSDFITTNNLNGNSFYEIPVDMNSTWFTAKNFDSDNKVTPVKKYQTTYMKKLCYLIWKEATMRVLKMGEINLNLPIDGFDWGQNNVNDYCSVQLLDIPEKRPGGSTTTTLEELFNDTYPQSKFYNKNINVYEPTVNGTKFPFYTEKSYYTGYKIISGGVFDGNYPGKEDTTQPVPYPNHNPTNAYINVHNPSLVQPPLLTNPTSAYTQSALVLSGATKHWTRLYIHQTEWWKNMVADTSLNSTEVNMMKTYLTLMSMWGANSMDGLLYNYPLMGPVNSLFRVNNLDLVTLGAFLWAGESKTTSGTEIKNIINSNAVFNVLSDGNPYALMMGDPEVSFPFNVVFYDNYNYVVKENKEFDRLVDYGLLCTPGSDVDALLSNEYGGTMFTNSAKAGSKQEWEMNWNTIDNPQTIKVTPFNLADDLKRDLINNFIEFVNLSDFTKNIDNNLDAVSTLREVAEIALKEVEDNMISEGDLAYHRFPFDIEQTLLMWADWASIVDLNNTTNNFKSFYDTDDKDFVNYVKRPEQKTVLSTKLFDMLTIAYENDESFDNPYKKINPIVVDGKDYYYSPWVRMKYKNGIQNDLLALKGSVGKKILLKLMKVITWEEQENYQSNQIITKRDNKFETTLNYKLIGNTETAVGNDQNYFFEHLFKGFYFSTINGRMRLTKNSSYDHRGLGGEKLFISKSWLDCKAPGWSKTSTQMMNEISTSTSIDKYFDAFTKKLNSIDKDNPNYTICQNNSQKNAIQRYNRVPLGADSLIYYMSFANLFTRWLAGASEDDHTYKRGGCTNITTEGDTSKYKSLVQNIFIVDRVNRPAGHLVASKSGIWENLFIGNPNVSVAGFFSELCRSNEWAYFEYPTFYNFGNSGVNMEDNPGKSMWGNLTTIDEKYAGPAIVIYVQAFSNPQTASDLNDYVNDDTSMFYDDFTKKESRGVMFKVALGNENNSIFTNLQIDSQEFKETYEHILLTSTIANEYTSGNPKFFTQSMYNLWKVRSFTANLECFGNMLIQTGMYFKLENIPIFEGFYIIKKVSHTIEAHQMKTKFWGSKVMRISAPFASLNPMGYQYDCSLEAPIVEPDIIDNDPGYCKETMSDILTAFLDEVKRVIGVTPIVYTNNEFLQSLSFDADATTKFYTDNITFLRKNNTLTPFTDDNNVNVTEDQLTVTFKEEYPQDYFSVDNPNAKAINGLFIDPTMGFGLYNNKKEFNITGVGKQHKGIDIKAIDKTKSIKIYASADGVITRINPSSEWDTPESTSDNRYSDPHKAAGNYLVIKHDINGTIYHTVYMHLMSKTPYAPGITNISPNNKVTKGQHIGYMGSTGNSTAKHLHFEIYKEKTANAIYNAGEPINPLLVLTDLKYK